MNDVTSHESQQVDPAIKPPQEAHRGTMILVLGILGLVCCFIFGIAAWVMGGGDLKKMDAGVMDPEGRGLTQAGRICGIISVVLTLLGLIIYVLLMLLGVAASAFA